MRAQGSIRRKLNRLVLISLGVALGLTACFSLWQETDRYIDAKREAHLATAKLFAAAASKAVAARDATTVLQALRAIGQLPNLIYAGVEDQSGALLTQIGEAIRLEGDADLDEAQQHAPLGLLTSQTVQVSVPVINGGERVGRIILISDTSDIWESFAHVLLGAGVAFAIAVTAGLFLALRLQRSITRPLVALAEVMAASTRDGAYGLTVEVTSDDETGVLASSFNSMTAEIRRATDEIVAREEEMIFRLSRAAEQRDDQTGQHILRVATLCRSVAEGLGLERQACANIYRAAPMHDVGKIGVRDTILFKSGRLDPDERREIEKHAEYGYRILSGSNSALIQLAAEIAYSHHERWDGTGYPRGLKGNEIPLPGRVTAVADVCDALASARPYKEAWSLDQVKAYLIENAGTQFDPACVEALVHQWPQVQDLYAGAAKHACLAAEAA